MKKVFQEGKNGYSVSCGQEIEYGENRELTNPRLTRQSDKEKSGLSERKGTTA